jgi:uncharacterized OB-fold protein
VTSRKQVPIAPDLFTWPSDDPRLIGSECPACGNVCFPAQRSCPRCGGSTERRIALHRTGTLWTWTSQCFRPKLPYRGDDTKETFRPYFVGYVELAGQVRVESRLEVASAAELTIGMPMELTIVKFRDDAQGNELMTYAFKPLPAQP